MHLSFQGIVGSLPKCKDGAMKYRGRVQNIEVKERLDRGSSGGPCSYSEPF